MGPVRDSEVARCGRGLARSGLNTGIPALWFAALGAARLAGPAGLAVLFYARELWAATPEGERGDPRLILEILLRVLATALAAPWIGVPP